MGTDKTEEDFFGSGDKPQEKSPEAIFSSSADDPKSLKASPLEERLKEPETFKVSKLGNDIPTIASSGVEIPPEYMEVVSKINLGYEMLPSLDYDSLYTELSVLGVKSTTGLIPNEIGRQLEQVQGARDRVSEIYNLVERHYSIKKAFITTLKNVWYKFCKQTNKEQREGEASYVIHNYVLDFAKVEALENVCKHIWSNLDNTQKTLQHKISIIEVLAKLDYGTRSAYLDFDFASSPHALIVAKTNSINGELNKENKNLIAPDAEECSF